MCLKPFGSKKDLDNFRKENENIINGLFMVAMSVEGNYVHVYDHDEETLTLEIEHAIRTYG